MIAESKKMGLEFSNSTLLPVWRHQLGIWANLGTFSNLPIVSGEKNQMIFFALFWWKTYQRFPKNHCEMAIDGYCLIILTIIRSVIKDLIKPN